MKYISVITILFLIKQLVEISTALAVAVGQNGICSDSSEKPDCTPGIVKTIFGQPISEKCAVAPGNQDTLYNCPVYNFLIKINF
jgi:hypothetical protein